MTTNEHAWVTRLAIILVIITAGLYISSANAETFISGTAEDVTIDTVTACSMASGGHQYNLSGYNHQLSGSVVVIGGQRCGSIGYGKRVNENIFTSTGYTKVRDDNAVLLQITYEFK